MCALSGAQEILLESTVIRLCCVRVGDDHEAVALRERASVLADDLFEPSTDFVSDDRLPDFFGDGEAEATVRESVLRHKDDDIPCGDSLTTPLRPQKVLAFAEPEPARKPERGLRHFV